MHLHLLHISKWLNSFVNTTIQYSILQIHIALLMFDKNENCHLCIELFLILFVTRLLLLLSPGRSAKYIRLQFYQFSCDYYFIHQKRQIESLDFPFGKQTDTQTHIDTFYCWYFDIDTNHNLITSTQTRHYRFFNASEIQFGLARFINDKMII